MDQIRQFPPSWFAGPALQCGHTRSGTRDRLSYGDPGFLQAEVERHRNFRARVHAPSGVPGAVSNQAKLDTQRIGCSVESVRVG